jgi:hypothetical protein
VKKVEQVKLRLEEDEVVRGTWLNYYNVDLREDVYKVFVGSDVQRAQLNNVRQFKEEIMTLIKEIR